MFMAFQELSDVSGIQLNNSYKCASMHAPLYIITINNSFVWIGKERKGLCQHQPSLWNEKPNQNRTEQYKTKPYR